MSSSADSHSAHHDNPYLAHHFESIEQQKSASTMGMWLFLAQEIMFFGGMFCVYAVYRALNHDAWMTASASLPTLIGGINTTILLLSSFSVAMGVYYTQIGKRGKVIWMLLITLALGVAFIVLKLVYEYGPKIEYGVFPGTLWGPDHHHYPDIAAMEDQGALQRFFWLYFVMTGMHALHMIIGFGIMIWLIGMVWFNRINEHKYWPMEIFGLYWHFVDIVWIFLFPMFYLVT